MRGMREWWKRGEVCVCFCALCMCVCMYAVCMNAVYVSVFVCILYVCTCLCSCVLCGVYYVDLCVALEWRCKVLMVMQEREGEGERSW